MSNPFHVDVNEQEGYICIAWHSREVMYWEESEWENDPELVFTIANYINIALTNPNKMLEICKKKL